MLDERWEYFQFCGRYRFAFQGLPAALRTQFIGLDSHSNQEAEAFFRILDTESGFSGSGKTVIGTYKGVSWKVQISGEREEHIDFFSQGFRAFLFLRIVLIPFLKRRLSRDGGFSLIGSAFVHRSKNFVLFGSPGYGKTRYTLEAAQDQGRILGDSELYAVDGKWQGVFQFLELRLKTVLGTSFWRRLTYFPRFQLFLYHGISFLTGRKINFNLCLPPKKLGVTWGDPERNSPWIFVSLAYGAVPQKISPDQVIQFIRDYENHYRNLFGDIFDSKTAFEQSLPCLREVLSRCSLWQLPVGCPLSQILNLDVTA